MNPISVIPCMFGAFCMLCVACGAAPQAERESAGSAAKPALAADSTTAPASSPSVPSSPSSPSSATVLLDRLEERGRTMREFTASIVVEQFSALTEEREVRRARIVMKGGGGLWNSIGIVVDEFIDASGRGTTDGRRFLFQDGWLIEIDPTRKQAVKRQLVRAGGAFDPLRIGEGPFVVPLGQPRAAIEREYMVSDAAIPDHGFFKALHSTPDGLLALRLVPREGTVAHRNMRSVVLVFDGATLAPRGVELTRPNGDTERVLLRESVIDGGIDESQAAVIALPDMTGWRVDERPLPPSGADGEASPAQPPREPRG